VLSPERRRNWVVVTALGVAIGVVVIAYPYALEGAVSRFGVRTVAAGLCALAVAGLLAPRGSVASLSRTGTTPTLLFPLLLGLAALTGSRTWLMLVPALVYVTLAAVFAASLRGEDSLIERGARYLAPDVPDFIRPYCRKVTAVWVAFFLASALAIGVLAVADAPDWWRVYSGGAVYGLMLAITIAEFFVRKTWFRYYFHGGPFDRLWSRLFPAGDTPAGRRSMEYIERFRAEAAAAAERPAD
jgi:uncharacterized membrane protein